MSQCNDYKSESQNVKSRFACVVSDANLLKYGNNKLQLPITKAECDVSLASLGKTIICMYVCMYVCM